MSVRLQIGVLLFALIARLGTSDHFAWNRGGPGRKRPQCAFTGRGATAGGFQLLEGGTQRPRFPDGLLGMRSLEWRRMAKSCRQRKANRAASPVQRGGHVAGRIGHHLV